MFAFLQDSAQGKEVMDEWKSPMLTESGMRSAFDQLDIDHDGHITLEGEKKKKIRNVSFTARTLVRTRTSIYASHVIHVKYYCGSRYVV